MHDLDARPTVIIYGNCQSDAATTIFNKHPGFAERYRAVYFPGYDHPTQRSEDIPAADFSKCAVLLEQRDRLGFAGRNRLPQGVRVVKFPALDFNLFWPLSCSNPFNKPRPGGPSELFAYGDRIIVDCVKKGMAADEILTYYLTDAWDEYHTNLNRLAALETARISLRDSQSDLQYGPLVLGRFQERRLFWTANHPTADLLAEMITLILAAAFPGEKWAKEADMGTFIPKYFSSRGPLGKVGVPIHPKVAAYLGLTWYDPNDKFPLESGKIVSYEEYFAELIRVSIDRHSAAAAATS